MNPKGLFSHKKGMSIGDSKVENIIRNIKFLNTLHGDSIGVRIRA